MVPRLVEWLLPVVLSKNERGVQRAPTTRAEKIRSKRSILGVSYSGTVQYCTLTAPSYIRALL